MQKIVQMFVAISATAGMVFAGAYDFDTDGGKYAYVYPYFVVNAAADTTLAAATIVKVQDADDEGTAISHTDFLAAVDGTFVKKGTGTLTIDEGLSAWTGDMHVMEGVMHVKHLDGFGLSSGANSVFVHNGATLLNENPPGVTKLDVDGYACRRVIAFEGTGYNSMGALRLVNDVGESTWCMMCYPTLTGDATIVLDNKNDVYLNWRPPSQMRFNGHTLTLTPAAGRSLPALRFNNAHNSYGLTSGKIVADKVKIGFHSTTWLDENGGEIVLTNNAAMYFGNSVAGTGRRSWPIAIYRDLAYWSLNYDQSGTNSYICWNQAVTNQNNWDGSIYLGGNVPLHNSLSVSYHNTGLTLNGPVSGTGGFRPYKSSNRRYYGDVALQLNHPGNTFTGGVVLGDGGRLIVRCNGALPVAGAGSSLTNGSMILCGDDSLTLPALKFHGTGLVDRVSWAGGEAMQVVKTGAGALVWNTRVGATELALNGGTFVYPPIVPDYSLVAGLLEYTNTYSIANFTDGVAVRAEGRPAVMSPQAAYGGSWAISNPDIPGYQSGINKIYSYRGYLWNRDATNVTWSMVSVMDKGARVIIDGETVLDQYDTDPSKSRNHAKTSEVTLTPGAHEFEFRYFCTSGNSGATTVAGGPAVFSYIDDEFFPTNSIGKHDNPAPGENGGLWTHNMGFGIDRQARRSHVYTDYEKAIDAGDGMLFTTSTNEADYTMPSPVFGTIAAAAGTAIDLNRRSVTLANLTGLPAVSNGTLTVSGTWTIAAADVAAGAVIDGTGAFALDPAATIAIDDVSLMPRSNVTLVATTGGVSVPAEFNGMRLDSRGRYRLTVTGNTLGVVYSCGTKILFR